MSLPIWENENLLVTGTFKRSITERLFTLPWRPFKSTYTVAAPSTAIYKMTLPGRLPFNLQRGTDAALYSCVIH